MHEFLDEQETFRRNYTDKGFTSTCDQFVSCAPYIIARAAQVRVVDDAEIVLPNGMTDESLSHIRQFTGSYYKEVAVSPRQADELRNLGRQILSLDTENKIKPPLTFSEKKSITHLVEVVENKPNN